jgi:hypothetical protein
MLPIAAHHARLVTEERAQSALPRAPMRASRPRTDGTRVSPLRDRLASALRRAADRLEPTTS